MDDALTAVVAERIRRLRTDAGLGVRELAREVGISPSSLSALENQRGGMSLGRLQQVSEHFGLSLTDLLHVDDGSAHAGQGEEVEIFRQAAANTRPVRRGTGVYYQLLGKGQGHLVQATLLSFEPGGSYEGDRLGHAGEEFAFVVLGEVELLLGEDVHRLGQGDGIRFRTETAHAYRNASRSGMAFAVTAAAPPW